MAIRCQETYPSYSLKFAQRESGPALLQHHEGELNDQSQEIVSTAHPQDATLRYC